MSRCLEHLPAVEDIPAICLLPRGHGFEHRFADLDGVVHELICRDDDIARVEDRELTAAAHALEREPALTPVQGVLLAYLLGRLIGRLAGGH